MKLKSRRNGRQQLFVDTRSPRKGTRTRTPAKSCCRGGSAPRYEPSGTVYSAASPLQANMRIPDRPCPVVLYPSFSLFLPSAARIPVPLPNRIPRQKYKDYFHASRGANRVADKIGISDRFSSENEKPQIWRISRQEKHFEISMERRAKKDLKI